jgi:hypothetical protein
MTPASVSTQLADEASTTGVVATVATADVQGIPAPALAAYQRAETVINAADESCNLSWQLLAAIGDVESHHGQFGVSRLDSAGVATPSIIGVPLNGVGNVALIKDTDAGVLDGDQVFDRAVGPMQFIPSTWSVVGVDSDNDGERNPQDIDDAALAAAVYLCSGDHDLSTTAGQVVAVNRYNHSAAYVERVLTLLQQYLAGGYATGPAGSLPTVPTSSVAAGRIDGLHPDDGPQGSPPPATRPPGADWDPPAQPPPRDDPDLEPPTEPEPPPEPQPEPQPSVITLPVAPWVDGCGPADYPNVSWVVPVSEGATWVVQGDRLVGTARPGWVFPGGAASYTFTLPADAGVLCEGDDPWWPNAPADPTVDWVPARTDAQWTLDDASAAAQCVGEGFDAADQVGYPFCVTYYLVPPVPEVTPDPEATPAP